MARRLIPFSLAMLLAPAAPAAHGMAAISEADRTATAKLPAPRSEARSGAEPDPVPGRSDEIVVTASRRGEAEVAAETEFGEDEIAGHGADSVQDLLARLSPFINAGGAQPVILINGRPIGFDRSILSYPAEALERLAVLKPEAAARYGEQAGRRVINLVLKKSFASLNVDAGFDFATAGGQYGGSLSAMRAAIDGDTRWNVQARVNADSAFLKSARDLPRRGGLFDGMGFVAAPGGGEIDPALSLAAGMAVTVAAVPAGATRDPGLDDFARTANIRHPVDPHRFETLRSPRRAAVLSLGLTRPIGAFSASFALNANRSRTEGKRGLPMASIIIPAGHPSSPFADDIILTRPFDGLRALRTINEVTSLGASLSLNGRIGGWQTSFGVNWSRSRADNLLESGVDVAAVQRSIDAGDPDFNPYGAWDENLLLALRSRTRGENLSVRANVRKAILDLPAGPIVWNVVIGASRNRTWSRQGGAVAGHFAPAAVSRRQIDGQLSLGLPISRQSDAEANWLGDLDVDLSASMQTMTGNRAQRRFSGNLSWSPWPVVQFRGSIDHAEIGPSFEQLDAPVETVVNRIFDYARQEVAEPVWITGGNPSLLRGERRDVSLAAMIRPLGQILTLNIGYRRSVTRGGVTSFPELTPAIEAAFPERVTRDGEGRLVTVDARAINIARNMDVDLTTGVTFRLVSGNRADPVQLSASLNHRWRLKNMLLVRPGLPAIDQLGAGGQPRHNLSAQLSIGKRGLGLNLAANWSAPGRVRGAAEDFIFRPSTTFGLSAFVEPDRLFASPSGKGVMNDFKLSVDVDNLFNGYRRVARVDGSIPAGFSRDEVDPLGRTVRLVLRKKF